MKFDSDLFTIVVGFILGPYFVISHFLSLNSWDTTWLGILLIIGGIISLYNKHIISQKSSKFILIPLALIGVYSLIYSFINAPGIQRFIILVISTLVLLFIYSAFRLMLNNRAIKEFSEGYELLNDFKHVEALKYFDDAVKSYPNNAIAWAGKSISLIRLNEYDLALESSKKAIDMKSGFKNFLTKDSRNLAAFNSHTLVLIYNKDYEDALTYSDKCLEIISNYIDWSNKGYILSQLGRFDEAIKCHNKSLEMDSNFEGAWSNKADTLRKMGKYVEAQECIDNALKINPNDPFVWLTMGKICCDMGNSSEAINAIEKSLRLYPEFRDAKKTKSKILETNNS